VRYFPGHSQNTLFLASTARGPDFDRPPVPRRIAIQSALTLSALNFTNRNAARSSPRTTETSLQTGPRTITGGDALGKTNGDSCTLPPCVQTCKKRLKKCLLPWKDPTCGSTPAEECLALYVCCIDEECCEPECPTVECDGVCCADNEICNADDDCVVPPAGCETAFARDAMEDPPGNDPFCGTEFTRWGWTNGPYPDATFATLVMYAGAGQCDITKGTEVGAATVEVTAGVVTVTVTPLSAYEFTELHIQVSCDPLKYALQDTTPTVAPGQYTYGPLTTETVVFSDGGSNPIDGENCAGTDGYWVIVHAVSCAR